MHAQEYTLWTIKCPTNFDGVNSKPKNKEMDKCKNKCNHSMNVGISAVLPESS